MGIFDAIGIDAGIVLIIVILIQLVLIFSGQAVHEAGKTYE